MTQSELWLNIFPSIPNNLQARINKLYRFGASDPLSVRFLIDELNNLKNNSEEDDLKLILNNANFQY
jgi:hypothetical protein